MKIYFGHLLPTIVPYFHARNQKKLMIQFFTKLVSLILTPLKELPFRFLALELVICKILRISSGDLLLLSPSIVKSQFLGNKVPFFNTYIVQYNRSKCHSFDCFFVRFTFSIQNAKSAYKSSKCTFSDKSGSTQPVIHVSIFL